MLDTLLQIGKTLRESGRLRHHRYIKSAPKVEKTKTGSIKTDVVYLSLPVREDFTFDFDNLETNFRNENIIPDFYFLEFKSSDNDRTSCKYIWGDILYATDEKGVEKSWYKMRKSSFLRAIEDEKNFKGTLIEKFRLLFAQHRERIESLLKENAKGKSCFLHFDFQKKHWYEFENELAKVNENLLGEFLNEQNGFLTLKKYLHKTLRAFNEKDSVLQLPNLVKGNEYKTKCFVGIDEVVDLLYAIDYSKNYIITIGKVIGINVLPKGEKLDAKNIEEFFAMKGFDSHIKAVGIISESNKSDECFSPFVSELTTNITQFDIIFTNFSGNTHTDIIELSSIEKDLLVELDERLLNIRIQTENNRKIIFEEHNNLPTLGIKQSFSNILSDFTKKYTNHLLKVLPQIYTGTYYRDAILLPAFLEKVQYEIRNYDKAKSKGKRPFNFLKFDYEFLVKLRNSLGNTTGEKEMVKMKDDINYKIGLLLGHLAQPVSRDINSFEKGYVGLLLRHISDLKGLVKFTNFINSKLAIHGRVANKVRKRSNELENIIGKIDLDALPNFAALSLKVDSMINEINEKNYNIEFCAFGFFEGYFSKYLKTQEDSSTEGEN